MSQEQTLEPCPFCGNEAHFVDDLIIVYASCTNCGATGAHSSYKSGAAYAWNHRAALSATQPAQAAPQEEGTQYDADDPLRYLMTILYAKSRMRSIGVEQADFTQMLESLIARCGAPAQAAQGEPTLRDYAADLVDAGHDFWKACEREAGGGAVRWLSCDDGTLIVFTRVEYRDEIMAHVRGYKAPVVVFDEDGMTALEAEAAQGEPLADHDPIMALDECARILESSRLLVDTARCEVAAKNARTAMRTLAAQGAGEVPMGAIVNGRVYIERLEMEGFEDSHGHRMTMCTDWHELRRCFEHLADWAATAPSQPAQVAQGPLPEGWRLEDIGPQIHIHKPEGKWTAVGCETPYMALIHRFLADLLSCTKPTQPAAGADVLTSAARDVLAERNRQVSVEQYMPEADDEYDKAELAYAAAAYAITPATIPPLDLWAGLWPWPTDAFKPSNRRRNMIKAGALILAEIERLDRAAIAASGRQS